ncbi:Orf y, partial [Tanacetum coccineum]
EKDFNSNEVRLLKELLKEKTEQVQQIIKDQAKEYYENRAIIQRKEELWPSKKSLLEKDLRDALKIIDQLNIEQIRFEEQKDEEIRKLKTQLQKEKEKETEARYSSEEFPPLGNSQIARPFMKAEVHYSGNTTIAPKIRKITNQLYNVKMTYKTTSQIKQLIIMEDPYRGSTDEQDKAYRDLDRITCEETKNLGSFLEDFRQLAVKSGKLYFPSTTEKVFAKLPPSLSKKIEELFKAKHPGLCAGVLPAIKFTHTFVSEMCKDSALAKELRDLSLCSAIPIPGYYKNNMKKYGIIKSRTYKGKPYNSHVKPFKRKYKDDRGRVKKCKCFICGMEGHFAKDYRSKQGNIARSAVYQELDLDDNWDIVSADFDDISVYSISKGEGDVHQNISIMVQDTPFEEDRGSQTRNYQPKAKVVSMIGKKIRSQTIDMSMLNCPKCQLTTCVLCARNYLGKTVNVKGKQPHKPEEEKDFHSNEVRLLKELLKEKMEQVQQMIKDQAKEYYENRSIMQRKEELWQSEKSLLLKDLTDALKIIDQLKIEQISKEFPQLGNSQIARPFMEAEVHYSGNTTTTPKIKKITNQLYNVKVEFKIPNCLMFGTTSIIDTRASACCINKKVIPEDALEPLTQTIFFNGLNSRQQATYRIKQGFFLIEGNKFKIPPIYAFDMNDSNGIEMLIGANFLRSMKGGIRIEGDEITIYKKVTRIKTSNQIEVVEVAITELEVSEEEFMEINESIYFNQEGSKAFLEQFKLVIERLKHQGYIGEEPLKL